MGGGITQESEAQVDLGAIVKQEAANQTIGPQEQDAPDIRVAQIHQSEVVNL